MDDKILEAFEFGKIQECKNIQLKLIEHNIGWDEFVLWIDDKAKRLKPNPVAKIPNIPQSVLKRMCPDCKNSWLQLAEVNHTPSATVGGNWKCQWFCGNCEWEEYSDIDIVEAARPYVEEMKVIYMNVPDNKKGKMERQIQRMEGSNKPKPCAGKGR